MAFTVTMLHLVTSKKFIAGLAAIVLLLAVRKVMWGGHTDRKAMEDRLLARFQYEGALLRMGAKVSRVGWVRVIYLGGLVTVSTKVCRWVRVICLGGLLRVMTVC